MSAKQFKKGQEVWIRGRVEQFDADDGIYMVTTASGYNDERINNFVDEKDVIQWSGHERA